MDRFPRQPEVAGAAHDGYCSGMSGLSEIETVVNRLTLAEQEELLRRLESSLSRRRSAG